MSGFDETLLGEADETVRVRFVVNGRKVACEVAPRDTLVDCLRDKLELTGTHAGCEMGACGACLVQLDGRAVHSCLIFAVQADGATVDTIEGLSERENEVLKPFLFDHQRDPMFQCRFSWRPGSIAFWDNRWAQHYAVPDYTGERRIMQRITIAGPPVV